MMVGFMMRIMMMMEQEEVAYPSKLALLHAHALVGKRGHTSFLMHQA